VHDCSVGKCSATRDTPLRQERLQATRTRQSLEHVDDIHYILNTHSLHNYQYIKDAVPPDLYGSSFFVESVSDLRLKAAEKIRKKKVQQGVANKIKKALKQGEAGNWGAVRKFIVEKGGGSQTSGDDDSDELPVFDRTKAKETQKGKGKTVGVPSKRKPRPKATSKKAPKARANSETSNDVGQDAENGDEELDAEENAPPKPSKGKGKRSAMTTDDEEQAELDNGVGADIDYDDLDKEESSGEENENRIEDGNDSPLEQNGSSEGGNQTASTAQPTVVRKLSQASRLRGPRAPPAPVVQDEEVSIL